MRTSVIGGGNIGTKRAEALRRSLGDEFVGFVETNSQRARELENKYQCHVWNSTETLYRSADVDAVIISTPPQSHIELICQALHFGKDVLCEKPLGLTLEEVVAVTHLANDTKRVLKCGFNLCHDQGIEYAKALISDGAIGKPFFIKGHYVNGCVITNMNRVGSLQDLGSHLIHLIHWMGWKPKQWSGFLSRQEYSLEMDDNGFLTFQADSLTGQIHFSFLRWKNDFCLEVSGEKGAIEIASLPKFGVQEVRLYQRVYPSGVPKLTIKTFEKDLSWDREWASFREACSTRENRYNNDALNTMIDISHIQKTIPFINFQNKGSL